MLMQDGGSATRGDTTTSQQTDAHGKRGAIGRGCSGGRVKRTRGRGVDTTISWQMRDNPVGSEGEGDSDGKKNAALTPSLDLAMISLVLATEALAALEAATAAALVLAAEAVALVFVAEAAAALKADDANDGDGSAAIVGGVSLPMGGGVIN